MADVDPRMRDFVAPFVLTETQLQEIYNRFGAEIRKGLAKDTRPNADTKCYVTYVQDLPTGEEVGQYLALDLGGSNFRVLLVTLKGDHEADLEFKTYSLTNNLITGPGKKLFDYIAECLANFMKEQGLHDKSLSLGFTFSFPCIQQSLVKATLVRWTKGYTAPGVVGEDVGKMLQEAIKARGIKIDVVAILNDTIGTLMSCAHRNPACRIGLILGTGNNACYLEHVDNVEMLEQQYKVRKTHVIINIEWGAFGEHGALEFMRTDIDRELDVKSLNRGQQIFEKMIGGMYLGQLTQMVLLRAIKENLIFTDCEIKRMLIPCLTQQTQIFETRHISEIECDVDDFTHTKNALNELFGITTPTDQDCMKLQYIAHVISKRAAKLAALGLAYLMNKMNEPKCIAGVDGTVYRMHPKFDYYMRRILQQFVSPKIEWDLMLSEDGSGRGAALVAAVASADKK